ncbi:MAG: DUF3108 domain-containing protein [Elusimicrobia bacterium]|nr:DUF3108 domain-containing protein [Elusimicrobiota bacterium]
MKILALGAALAGGLARAEAVTLSSAAISSPYGLSTGTTAFAAPMRPLTVYPERLVYDVSWGLLPVGEAALSVQEIVLFAGRPAYHVVSTADSNKFCDAFYQVRDINESWIDAERLVSLGYAKKLREGRYFRDEWVLYDQENGNFLAKLTSKDGNYSYSAGTSPISVQDILSSLYYIRFQNLVPGREIVLDVNTKQNWPLVIKVVKRETVKTPAGKFQAILVEPAIRQEGIFIQKGKRLQVWLSDDARKVPVLMKVEVFFGHVTAALSKML